MNDERGCIDSDFGLIVRYQGETAAVDLNVRWPRWWMSCQSVQIDTDGSEAEQGAGEHLAYAYRS